MPDAGADWRRRAALFWLMIGSLQVVMATLIGLWMLLGGRQAAGSAVLLVAALIGFGVRWKHGRLLAGG